MTHGQPGDAWTAGLRRRPARIADGPPEGGDTGLHHPARGGLLSRAITDAA
jgi:hypothetical protein